MAKKAAKVFILILFTLGLVSGCGRNSMEAEYEAIRDSGLTGEALLGKLSEFELRNMGHFSSKVDLGGYYFLSGDIERGADYFRRAEALVKQAPADEDTQKNITIMYGTLAQIHSIRGEYDIALGYAEKAARDDTEQGLPYGYLRGHILLEKGEHEKALEVFDPLFKSHADRASPDNIRAYMYLLGVSDRPAEAAAMADLYFEKGPYFPGLGLFASSVYEAAGEQEKAVYAAFLDYEYQCGYRKMDHTLFLKNLETLENRFASQNRPIAGAINLVRSLYDASALPFIPKEASFFAEEYIILKEKILEGTLGAEDFSRYLDLEHYFSSFPVYYWNLWQGVSNLKGYTKASYLSALERIIALDKDGVYAQGAWNELSKTLGFKSDE
ncbi:hypothetical protein AGMMS50268_00140 [Spirochaetia bacterium]|nr:hypothetical protein AGMMS50268_00140 [Spirochaetia bacterium]